MSRERDFDLWVRERLADWPTQQILEFERWLLEDCLFEFVPAVHEALRHRSIDGARGGLPTPKLVADLVLRLKGLVHVRALLEDRGASVIELAEHTAEIDRLRAQLAALVKEAAA